MATRTFIASSHRTELRRYRPCFAFGPGPSSGRRSEERVRIGFISFVTKLAVRSGKWINYRQHSPSGEVQGSGFNSTIRTLANSGNAGLKAAIKRSWQTVALCGSE